MLVYNIRLLPLQKHTFCGGWAGCHPLLASHDALRALAVPPQCAECSPGFGDRVDALVGAGSYRHVPGALRVGRVVAGVVWGANLPLQLQALPQSYVHFTSCKYRHSKPCSLSAQPQPGEAMQPAFY